MPSFYRNQCLLLHEDSLMPIVSSGVLCLSRCANYWYTLYGTV